MHARHGKKTQYLLRVFVAQVVILSKLLLLLRKGFRSHRENSEGDKTTAARTRSARKERREMWKTCAMYNSKPTSA